MKPMIMNAKEFYESMDRVTLNKKYDRMFLELQHAADMKKKIRISDVIGKPTDSEDYFRTLLDVGFLTTKFGVTIVLKILDHDENEFCLMIPDVIKCRYATNYYNEGSVKYHFDCNNSMLNMHFTEPDPKERTKVYFSDKISESTLNDKYYNLTGRIYIET